MQVIRKVFRKIDDILAIEDTLIRISNQLSKTIKQLNNLLFVEVKKKLLIAQIERERMKLEGEKEI